MHSLCKNLVTSAPAHRPSSTPSLDHKPHQPLSSFFCFLRRVFATCALVSSPAHRPYAIALSPWATILTYPYRASCMCLLWWASATCALSSPTAHRPSSSPSLDHKPHLPLSSITCRLHTAGLNYMCPQLLFLPATFQQPLGPQASPTPIELLVSPTAGLYYMCPQLPSRSSPLLGPQASPTHVELLVFFMAGLCYMCVPSSPLPLNAPLAPPTWTTSLTYPYRASCVSVGGHLLHVPSAYLPLIAP